MNDLDRVLVRGTGGANRTWHVDPKCPGLKCCKPMRMTLANARTWTRGPCSRCVKAAPGVTYAEGYAEDLWLAGLFGTAYPDDLHILHQSIVDEVLFQVAIKAKVQTDAQLATEAVGVQKTLQRILYVGRVVV